MDVLVKLLQYSPLLIGFTTTIIGIGFYIAGLKIKNEINLQITQQLAQISINQAKQVSQGDMQFTRMLIKIRGWIDKNSLGIAQNKQEISQIKQFLKARHDFHDREGLPDNTLLEDTNM